MRKMLSCSLLAVSLVALACEAAQPEPTTPPAKPVEAIKSRTAPVTSDALQTSTSYTNGLRDAVLLGLIMDLGTTNHATGTNIANVVASDCQDATNQDSLYAGLTNGFGFYGYDFAKSTNASDSIAGTFAPGVTQVSNLVFLSLAIDFPAQYRNRTRTQAYSIAGSCTNDTTSAALFTNLVSAFGEYSLTNGSTSASNTAAAICEVIFTSGSRDIFPAMQMSAPTVNFGRLFFWTGVKLLSPYTINGINANSNPRQLQANNSQADPFIEVDFDESYVMQDGVGERRWSCAPDSDWYTKDDSKVHWALPWYDVFDVSGSFGYVFGPSNSTNSYSASTIVSAGDIYGRASLGFPLLRYCNSDASWKEQLSLNVQGGFTTDKQFDSVHPNFSLGFGYQGRFPNFVGATNLPIFWLNNLGPAWIDQPELNGTNVVFTTGNTGGLSEPDFRLKFVPFCWQSKIIIPVTKSVNIQCGGDVYIGSKPANWDITLGASLDLEKLLSSITGSLGLAASQ